MLFALSRLDGFPLPTNLYYTVAVCDVFIEENHVTQTLKAETRRTRNRNATRFSSS